MGMFDYVKIHPSDYMLKKARLADLNAARDSHMQTKFYGSRMDIFLLCRDGIYMMNYIKEETGEIKEYEFAGEKVTYEKKRNIGYRLKPYPFLGSFIFSARTASTDEYRQFVARYVRNENNDIYMADITLQSPKINRFDNMLDEEGWAEYLYEDGFKEI